MEENPCRAGIVGRPEEYRWSSAAVHFGLRGDRYNLIDLPFWQRSGGETTWREMYAASLGEDQIEALRQCTYGGRPFGGDDFVAEIEKQFGRSWRRNGEPEKLAKSA